MHVVTVIFCASYSSKNKSQIPFLSVCQKSPTEKGEDLYLAMGGARLTMMMMTPVPTDQLKTTLISCQDHVCDSLGISTSK